MTDHMHTADLDAVRRYYGETLKTNADLKTNACCTGEDVPAHVKAVLVELDDEILSRYYGCGSPIPEAVEGAVVLDLGCGSGRDAFVLSRLVGESGRVIGIDMTEAQLAVAQRHRETQTHRFGYAKPNVEFRHGFIEDLAEVGIADASVDLIVSNCVINLSPDKPRVLREAFRALKPGGELYFSDVFADRRIPADLRSDPVLLGECLSGAMYWEDFRRTMAEVGCLDVRVVHSSPIALHDPTVKARIGMVGFSSVTVRAFKLPLEDRCEDYGQVARYLGTMPEAPHAFVLDDHHRFEAGRPMTVCGNTADMLGATRYARHFRIDGDKSTHFGLFQCGPAAAPQSGSAETLAGCC